MDLLLEGNVHGETCVLLVVVLVIDKESKLLSKLSSW